MAIADSKKVQSMINICAEQMLIIRAAMETMVTVRTAFQTHDPDVTGTPLEGKVATVNAALTSLNAETDAVVWTQLIAAYRPSHRGKALE